MADTEISWVLKLGPLTASILWVVCLSFPFLAGVRDFTYLFVASHPPTNAQLTFLVVRKTEICESLPACLPSLLAECLCSIRLVVLVGMGTGSGIGAEQKGQDCRRFSEMSSTLRNGDGHSYVPAWEGEEKPSGAGVAASSRKSAQLRAAGVSSFQTQSIEEGRRGGSGSPQASPSCAPPKPGVSTPRVPMFSAMG